MKRLLVVILWMGISGSLGAGEVGDNQKACDDGMVVAFQDFGDIKENK